MIGFGSVGDTLQIVIRKNDNSIETNVEWDNIIWSEVKEIGLKSINHVVGFHKNLSCIVWYPLEYGHDKPLFYIYEKALGKIGENWHTFYITTSGTQKTPYHILNNDILPDERRLGWTGTITYSNNDFPVDVGIQAEPYGLPQRLKTKITTPINLDEIGIEYQLYLNPEYASEASKNIKWVRVYTTWNPAEDNYEYTDYDIGQAMEIVNVPDLPIYRIGFLNQDKDKFFGYFNFNDIFKSGSRESYNKLIKIEEVTLPNNETTYCIRVACSFGSINAGETLDLDPIFGSQNDGITRADGIGKILLSKFQMGATGGTGDSISVYVIDDGAYSGGDMKCALYDASLNLVTNGITEQISNDAEESPKRYTLNFNPAAKPNLTANAWYYLAVWSSNDTLIELFYDNSGGSGIIYDTQAYSAGDYSGFPDPASNDGDIDTDGNGSIYCTYTESAGANPLVFGGTGKVRFYGGSKKLQFIDV